MVNLLAWTKTRRYRSSKLLSFYCLDGIEVQGIRKHPFRCARYMQDGYRSGALRGLSSADLVPVVMKIICAGRAFAKVIRFLRRFSYSPINYVLSLSTCSHVDLSITYTRIVSQIDGAVRAYAHTYDDHYLTPD